MDVALRKKDCYRFKSPRIFGDYVISRQASVNLTSACNGLVPPDNHRLKARLATILIDRIVAGEEVPFIDSKLVDYAIENTRPLPVAKRARRLLEAMARSARNVVVVDAAFHLFMDESLLEGALGASESINEDELKYFLSYLTESKLIRPSGNNNGGYVVTVQGHELIEQEIVSENSNKVFVAMWFGSEVNSVWLSIKSAVESAGYLPRRIDYGDHGGLIDDAIISEIRDAKFLIVDLTHGKDGQRGSVYYEAGFGRGLNRPVIQTVRQDHLDDSVPNLGVAFDLNHYPVIAWREEDLEDFKEALLKRIKSRFGESTSV